MSKIKCDNWSSSRSACWAHAKLDGHFVRARRSVADNILRLWTSHPTDITADLDPRILPYVIERGVGIVGELHVPGEPASFVKSAIKHGDARLNISWFAIELLPNIMSNIAEWDLDRVAGQFNQWRLPFAYYERFDGDAQATLSRFVAMGYEGVVLKESNLLGWHKLKAVQTVDLVCTGIEPGQGKYIGQVGALKGSIWPNREVASVSGMDDVERASLGSHVIGRVFEVEYQYVGSQGRLRHPRFVRWRDDKQPYECTEEQLS